MEAVPGLLVNDLERLSLIEFITRGDLSVPVYSTFDGSLLNGQVTSQEPLLEQLAVMQAVREVNWPKALSAASRSHHVTHICDFGPGNSSTVTARVKDGEGVQVIQVNSDRPIDERVLPRRFMFATPEEIKSIPFALNYSDYLPRLQRLSDGNLHVDTKFSRVTGKPPLMVAGMTPTTANEQIVIAFTNAGFHGEFAGGGQANPEMFKQRITNIFNKILPGEGINVNSLYLNQKQWGFQFPMSLQMRSEGVPIDSITIGAGVPSLEKASEIIQGMKEAGLRFLGFKPGSVSAIKQVVQIAKHNPNFHIMLQWTGGRGGGHHSFEDAHDPVMQTYRQIRKCDNIVLVMGSGIGDGKDALKYLTGAWSVPYGHPIMPFDAVLVASRIMASAEASTSLAAKELLVATPGCEESEWEKSYTSITGGVTTVISELGEPIHMVATRATIFWKELDNKYFSLPLKQQESAILKDRDYIIERINKDYQKLYFGFRREGSYVHLGEMTYEEVARRMVDLMFLANSEWIHNDYKKRLVLFLQRIEERFSTGKTSTFASSIVPNSNLSKQLDQQPNDAVTLVVLRYPQSRTYTLSAEDEDYFLHLCKDKGKPVNFIPVIDKSLSFWFKKDSLWYSESLECVPDQDVQRVVILQSPVTVKSIKKVNEPIGEILSTMEKEIIQELSTTSSDNQSQKDNITATLDGDYKGFQISTAKSSENSQIRTFKFSANSEPDDRYLDLLASAGNSWWKALVSSNDVIHFKFKRPNYFRRILSDREHFDRIELTSVNGTLERVSVFPRGGKSSEPLLTFDVTVATGNNYQKTIAVTFAHVVQRERGEKTETVPLRLLYNFLPKQVSSPVHLSSSESEFNDTVKKFYASLWLSNGAKDVEKLALNSTFVSTKKVNKADIEMFCRAIGRTIIKSAGSKYAPVDFAVVVAWEALSCGLFAKEVDASLFNLLHLSYGYEVLRTPQNPYPVISEGDVIKTNMKITEHVNLHGGKRLTVLGQLYQNTDENPIMEVTSQFFFRGDYTNANLEDTFRVRKFERIVEVKSADLLGALLSRKWIQFDDRKPVVGDRLLFQMASRISSISLDEKSFGSVETTGTILLLVDNGREAIGRVQFQFRSSEGQKRGIARDPVEFFLERHGKTADNVDIFDSGGYVLAEKVEISAPHVSESEFYATASGDLNPIHYNSGLAAFAGLNSTIIHGMWTAAVARNLIDSVLSMTSHDANNSYQVAAYKANFQEKISAGEKLTAKITHVGMKNGFKMMEIEIKNANDAAVLKCSAQVGQPITAFVFTGQGSAEPKMGMDVYRSSAVAKHIWDRAEKHMLETYGFSILDIIQNNPKKVSVSFLSEKGGKVREKYMSLKHISKHGEQQLFPDISENTGSYTFEHPQGVLFQTQFQQPALTLVEKAYFEDMKSRGLVPNEAYFAGHSLGEYSAISSVANVLSIEELVELVFIRGITMQNCVQRNEKGLSPFGMVAVNTQRVSPLFTPLQLDRLVNHIKKVSGNIIQVVNYNVENWQYIVTGYNSNLETMRVALDFIKKDPRKAIDAEMHNLITKTLAEYPDPDQVFTLSQGSASIPLPGIDVPFHSEYLLSEVPQFRNYLLKTIDPKKLDVSLLEAKYVPNLTAAPFEVSFEYAKNIIDGTKGQAHLAKVMKNKTFDLTNAEDKRMLGYYILVDLLAFQFASPVRWIESQEFLFKSGVSRFIEIGPAATLAGMAKRTLQLHTSKFLQLFPPREVLSFKSDHDNIYYNISPTFVVKSSSRPKNPTVEKLVDRVPVTARPSQKPLAEESHHVTVITNVVTGDVTSDIPTLNSLDAIRVLLGVKLKKSLSEVQDEHSIKDLVGGKSAIQNEIVGDFQKEFGSEPEGAASMPINQLAQQWSGYKKLGPVSNGLISKLMSGKLAPGFGMSEIKTHLLKEHGLEEGQIESVLMHSLSMEPTSRLEEQGTKDWLSQAATSFAAMKGKRLVHRSKMSAGGSGGPQAQVVDSAVLNAFQKRIEDYVKQALQSNAIFLGEDLVKDSQRADQLNVLRSRLESDIKSLSDELGDQFLDGIKPIFDGRKVRRYNSWWAWGRQEAASLFYDTMIENPQSYDSEYCERVQSLINRGTPELEKIVHDFSVKAYRQGNQRVANHVANLAERIKEGIPNAAVWKIIETDHTGPHTEVSEEGKIIYKEIPRPNISSFADFVKEMHHGYTHKIKPANNAKLYKRAAGSNLYVHLAHNLATDPVVQKRVPYIFCRPGRSEDPSNYDVNLTKMYYNSLEQIGKEGMSFTGKVILVTGCGRGSIGFEILKFLLQGGATVICTTSRPTKANFDIYQSLYQKYAGKQGQLFVVPFNAGSHQDVDHLIEYIYNDLKFPDIDYIVPFAAVSENGRDISNLDSLSELSHRIMLTNVLRIIGKVKSMKEQNKLEIKHAPTVVVLPLSPNHGTFGSDGLYSESKVSLEMVFNKFESEGWQDTISIVGAVIGWTRGTGLMESNNLVAAGIEKMGVRTFSQREMAIALACLMGGTISTAAHHYPLWVDITGGMKFVKSMNTKVEKIRVKIFQRADILRASFREDQLELELTAQTAHLPASAPELTPKANFESFRFPDIENVKADLQLQGLIDLERTVVVVGFGEVGPWGNRRTRWDIESRGTFSVEGCIELAFIMGLIKYHSGILPSTGVHYIGWIDAAAKSPVRDMDVKELYEETILKHCGVREWEPELFWGYNPHAKSFLHEVALTHDMPPIEVFSKEESDQYKLEHGEKVSVFSENGKYFIQMKKGANIRVPRAMKFDRYVAGQIPSSWDPALFGISKEIINQVDRVTLFNLVSTCEALISAGLVDPYELYEYVHVSEVGNTSGSGIGGLNSIRKVFRERTEEKPIQSDILQETFINVIPAWINMMILGTSGPIKIPVGACATAAISVELGVDTILSGKAKVVIVGGYDDLTEESSYEFGQMKATNNSEEDIKDGRVPREHSRPATDTRHGFVESHGAGTEILTSADLALKMGLPIYGIVALTNTATDKIGRSVPAPGRGILTTAREVQSESDSPLLSLDYRIQEFTYEISKIQEWKAAQLAATHPNAQRADWPKFVEQQVNRKVKAAQATWGSDFFVRDPAISPLKGALAVWGLTVDDIGVISMHGTSTQANDKNESAVTQLQMEHLKRTPGNGLFTITQKYLTGHPKGAAAAWMLNGMIQSLLSGVVPGNRNADNIDVQLEQYDFLIWTSKSIQTTGMKAGLLKSFGFGQASAEILMVHPSCLFGALTKDQFEQYKTRRAAREQKTYAREWSIIAGKQNLVQVKDHPPYSEVDEPKVYLNPTARITPPDAIRAWAFGELDAKATSDKSEVPFSISLDSPRNRLRPAISSSKSIEVLMKQFAENMRSPTDRGIGVDVQLTTEVNMKDPTFLNRNFTEKEIAYAESCSEEVQKDRLAGRFAAKEAIIKAITSTVSDKDVHKSSIWKSAGSPLKDIEVLPTALGPPAVKLHGHAEVVARTLGIQEVKVTISHSGEYAVAQAVVK
eukprot:TRINITY_DN1795_c0_g1_i2.p1 TRINITY_DN1795_c0_g1~~TRINITY_DN1795_c0_g1_i2.p1  ORF type:complete len:3793 (+),score=1033.24 TRINITY_DN1795_c0_g1_i2:910-11379(+)